MRPIVLLLACAAMVACGSDGGELSVAEYRDRGNELCDELTDEAERVPQPRSIAGMADYVEELRELSQPYDRRFRQLDPPDELARPHRAGVEINEELDHAFARIVDRLRAATDPAVALRKELERLLPVLRRGDDAFRRLGLDRCLAGPQLGAPADPS